jgi:hypothetical protein
MRSFTNILVVLFGAALFLSCSKSDTTEQPSSKPVISNLVYSPSTVTINTSLQTFTVTGTLDFSNAAGGVKYLKIIIYSNTSTVPLEYNTVSQGTITVSVQFLMPATPGALAFEVFIVDNRGGSSNKLQGSINMISG